MGKGPLSVVREGLQGYADRGVFRGFSEVKAAGVPHAFRFEWLTKKPLLFCVDTEKGVLKFKNILPNLPRGSPMYVELRRFLSERSTSDVPTHRRIDPKRAELTCVNRNGNVSISIQVKRNQFAYGVNRIVNVVHEIFVHLNDSYADYMWENFDLPQE
jgi:hypothetical protein